MINIYYSKGFVISDGKPETRGVAQTICRKIIDGAFVTPRRGDIIILHNTQREVVKTVGYDWYLENVYIHFESEEWFSSEDAARNHFKGWSLSFNV
jgi:hypothetical protein